MTKTTYTETTLKTATQDLHELFGLSRSKEVYTVNKASASGMTTRIKFYAIKNETIVNITHEVAVIVNVNVDKNGYAVFGGAQTTHREDAVRKLSEWTFFNDRYLRHQTLCYV